MLWGIQIGVGGVSAAESSSTVSYPRLDSWEDGFLGREILMREELYGLR